MIWLLTERPAFLLRWPEFFVSLPAMIYLLIEFLDELVFGVGEAAWPLIRDDLRLTYVQIGLALSLPRALANGIEPFLFVLGDLWKRRAMILPRIATNRIWRAGRSQAHSA